MATTQKEKGVLRNVILLCSGETKELKEGLRKHENSVPCFKNMKSKIGNKMAMNPNDRTTQVL